MFCFLINWVQKLTSFPTMALGFFLKSSPIQPHSLMAQWGRWYNFWDSNCLVLNMHKNVLLYENNSFPINFEESCHWWLISKTASNVLWPILGKVEKKYIYFLHRLIPALPEATFPLAIANNHLFVPVPSISAYLVSFTLSILFCIHLW